jgi:hypothetical protein
VELFYAWVESADPAKDLGLKSLSEKAWLKKAWLKKLG